MRLFKSKAAAAALLTLGLAGCAREGDIQQTGILTSYTACPPVAIAAPAGDITLFNPADSRDASAIDVVANITNVRCDLRRERREYRHQRRPSTSRRSAATIAARARSSLPYFATVVQGGTNVVAKRVSRVGLRFADGQLSRQHHRRRHRRRCCARPRPCPRTSAARSPASAAPAIPTRRSTRWPIPPSAPRSSAPASRCWSASSSTQEQLALQRDALSALTVPIDSRGRLTLQSGRVAGGRPPVDARESVAGREPAAAEGATAPESLRQKDRAAQDTLESVRRRLGEGGPPKG